MAPDQNAEPRLRGIVLAWDDKTGFGTLTDIYGEARFSAARKGVRHDNFGRCYLVPGETVLFSIYAEDAGKATDVFPISRKMFEPMPADYRELVTVSVFYPERCFGFAIRPLGGQIFFHQDNCVTEGWHSIREGSQLYIGIEKHPGLPGKWRANPIEICLEPPEEKETVLSAALERAGIAL